MKTPPKTLLRLINDNKSFLILSHLHPEADAVGSSIGFALGLKKAGKEVYVLNRDIIPEVTKFLPFSNIVSQKIPKKEFDVLMLLDCNEIKRTGLKEKFEKGLVKAKNIAVVDHHLLDSPSRHISWINPAASATGELVYKLLKALRIPLDSDIATNLYASIFTDTGGFRYSNTTAETLQISASLIEAGAEPWEITKQVYESFSFNRLRLLTLCLLTLDNKDMTASITITRDMYKKTKTTVEDTEDFVNYPRKIKDVEVAVLFREDERNLYKISFRSKGRVNVQKVAQSFGGGGHRNASGCEVKGPLKDVKRKVLGAVRKAIKEA
ncbi:MAG: bifunctional oligoribonuclease/PAP phosphatase NrnA [Nitrospirae bacterium]|nr:bifunctional oligoribonuclease/PAP phosphatase NrnA [Nitrospirota bacterium]